jgi:hypothetical protein
MRAGAHVISVRSLGDLHLGRYCFIGGARRRHLERASGGDDLACHSRSEHVLTFPLLAVSWCRGSFEEARTAQAFVSADGERANSPV